MRRRFVSYVNVEQCAGEWIVVQYLNAEDARAVADALGSRDAASVNLHRAADDADERNEDES